MRPIARSLQRHGFSVCNVDYPSRSQDVAGLVAAHVAPVFASLGRDRPVHVVTHSLGGILLRYHLQGEDLPSGSRVVMLAPPNHGSEVADALQAWWPYRRLLGPAAVQLGTGERGIAGRLAPVSPEIGVIAATRSLQPWFACLLPRPNDGVVSVDSARLAEMRDFIAIDTNHTTIMYDRRVRRQVVAFLENGRFERGDRPGPR
jgi:hypothetical protein